MQFVGLFVLIILACLFLSSFQGCERSRPTGAMCYVVVATPPTAEYVCPVCGQKTLYDKDYAAWAVESMEACRREFDLLLQVSPLKMKLDESSFCGKCSPNATEHQLVLTVTHEDGTTHSIAKVNENDFRLLRDYFQGRLTEAATGWNSDTIQSAIHRVHQLLGRHVPVPLQKQ